MVPPVPERCTPELLSKLAELSSAEQVPVYTHIYESRPMTLIARQTHPSDGGSLVNYLRRVGLLTPRMNLAHSVWMSRPEIETIAEAGTKVVLNPVGNLKTRSGVAPIRTYLRKNVGVALGCDNCSCSDAQNMFQSMKLFAGLAAVTHPDPGPPTAADAIWSATVGGARSAGLEGRIGALRPGMAADLFILDLTDPSFVPLNSVARQVVFTEGGRGVETVIVDGRVVVKDRRITTIDERALREEIAGLMQVLRKDIAAVVEAQQCHVALSDGGAAPDLGGRYRRASVCGRCGGLMGIPPLKGEVDSICPALRRGKCCRVGSRHGALSTIMAGSRDPTRLATLADLPLSGRYYEFAAPLRAPCGQRQCGIFLPIAARSQVRIMNVAAHGQAKGRGE